MQSGDYESSTRSTYAHRDDSDGSFGRILLDLAHPLLPSPFHQKELAAAEALAVVGS